MIKSKFKKDSKILGAVRRLPLRIFNVGKNKEQPASAEILLGRAKYMLEDLRGFIPRSGGRRNRAISAPSTLSDSTDSINIFPHNPALNALNKIIEKHSPLSIYSSDKTEINIEGDVRQRKNTFSYESRVDSSTQDVDTLECDEDSLDISSDINDEDDLYDHIDNGSLNEIDRRKIRTSTRISVPISKFAQESLRLPEKPDSELLAYSESLKPTQHITFNLYQSALAYGGGHAEQANHMTPNLIGEEQACINEEMGIIKEGDVKMGKGKKVDSKYRDAVMAGAGFAGKGADIALKVGAQAGGVVLNAAVPGAGGAVGAGADLISSIVGVGVEIGNLIVQAHLNKGRAGLLLKRVTAVCEATNGLSELDNSNSSRYESLLESLLAVLTDIKSFVNSYTDCGIFMRVVCAHSHHDAFKKYNKKLQEHCQDVTFGLTVSETFNAEEDRERLAEDMNELLSAVDVLSSDLQQQHHDVNVIKQLLEDLRDSTQAGNDKPHVLAAASAVANKKGGSATVKNKNITANDVNAMSKSLSQAINPAMQNANRQVIAGVASAISTEDGANAKVTNVFGASNAGKQ